VGCGGGHVRIASAPKNFEMIISGLGRKEGAVGSGGGESFSGEAVHQICGSVKGLNPVSWRETHLKQKGTQSVIDGAKGTLGFTILLGGVWTRHAEGNTVGEEERAGRRIVKFMAIVTLNTLDGGAKLRANISEKVRKSGKCLGFEAKWKSPNVVRTIIKNNKIIFVS
jgi:hypothetical protein